MMPAARLSMMYAGFVRAAGISLTSRSRVTLPVRPPIIAMSSTPTTV